MTVAQRCSTFLLATLACLGAAACSDSSAPRPLSAGLHILSGAPASDTIGAVLPTPLTVILVDSSGKGIPNRPVTFEDFSVAPPYVGYVMIAIPARTPGFTGKVTVMSDNAGRASILMQCGGVAGVAAVVISAPDAPAFDTARVTVLPGAPVGVQAFPSDSAVYVGHHFALRGTMVDQAYNPIAHSVVQYSALTPDIAISNGQLSGVAIGRGSYVVSATIGGVVHTDTGRVSVVPPGVLAASDGAHIYLLNTDGSNFRLLATTPNGNLHWAPSGAEIAFNTVGSGVDSVIQAVDTLGHVRAITSPTIGGLHEAPQYSRDGQWIYFARVGTYPGTLPSLWRVHPDGSGAAQISALGDYNYPSPSPDGTQLAFEAQTPDVYSAFNAVVTSLTISTGTLSTLDLAGAEPVWSPVANTIAYVNQLGGGNDQGPIWVVSADGTGAHQVGTGNYNPGPDWSPDGQWLVAPANGNSTFDFVLEIVNAQSGLRLRLEFLWPRSLTAAWRP
jgi:hypothetical protein